MAENAETKVEQKQCEACGERFGCGANADRCWCTSVELTADAAAALKSSYSDCLCPKCLDKQNEDVKKRSI
ncbi:MAG: cysteine-rich CWC family protein [Pyrinomonadaceae bacterium]|nr:cysteine-rich CWC family protein [Pyrinomonadaceae bacterium]MBP6213579.1 cysteine-rich CWC family protein [Pyrinomonadaceae bacterium]